jgi:signal transduction histidine kinase
MDLRQQSALIALAEAAQTEAGLPALLAQAAQLAAGALGAEYGACWEVGPECDALVLRGGAGWRDGALGSAIADTDSMALVRQGWPGAIDWSGEARAAQPALLREHGVRSSLAAVIGGPRETFGVLSVHASAPRVFSAAEIAFLRLAASILALAFRSMRADQTLEARVEQRTRDIEQRLVAAAQEKAVLEERQRLARDLHDSVTQALYSVTLHGEVGSRMLAAGDIASAADALRVLQATAQEVLDEMRLLIFELRPPVLEQVGLVAALQMRLNSVEGRANLQTRLIVEDVDDLPPDAEQALYRIAQEALNNALKHARARNITIRLRRTGPRVRLEIADDGVGFDPATVAATGGMGLRGIAERVAQLGGVFALESAPGMGTRLNVEIAL